MPCSDAMIRDVITAKPDMTVEQALHILEEKDIRGFPVVNDDNQVIGIFNFPTLIAAVLPFTISLDDEFMHHKNLKLTLDYSSGQAPWLATRLKGLMPKTLSEVIANSTNASVNPETPLGEGLRRIHECGSPLPVVEKGSNVLAGIITAQSVISYLMKIKDNLEDLVDTKI